MAGPSPSDLYGLVDMGSNGIRFSITDLTPATSRSLPVVFQERLGVSLYDAQFKDGKKGPIPQKDIDAVLDGLKRFKDVCADFEVPENQIKILATEATRNAENSEDYRKQIKDATGWEVNLLKKEDEGRIGALGIASSFDKVDGLVMDLGGGSTQLTWMIYENGEVTTSPSGSVSFPFGAAAMTQRLSDIKEAKNSSQGRADFKSEIKQKYIDALDSITLPDSLKARVKSKTMTLYLSGGGFRGWGYILMSRSKNGPYPIPIINGYQVSVKEFSDAEGQVQTAEDDGDIFRVSKRRASQVPAVAFLVSAIMEAFPFIADVRFCQGGVREGYLFDKLPANVKSDFPLSSATSRYAVDAASSAHFAALLQAALPSNSTPSSDDDDSTVPASLSPSFIRALADTMYVQSNAPKESSGLSALYLPVTGVLTAAHGVSHADRAMLGLALCQRWEGELSPPHDVFQRQMQSIVSPQEAWWATYLGAVAALVGDVYPAGKMPAGDGNQDRIQLSSVWAGGLGKKEKSHGVVLTVKVPKVKHGGAVVGKALLKDYVESIEDMGKKKNRIGGREDGFGVVVSVQVQKV